MAVAPAAPLVAAPAWHGGALGVEVEVGGDSWTLDASKLDVDAFLGETVGGWAAMTCDVLQASWATGASRDDGVLTRTEAGTADVVLANPDRRYDPLWPSAPFYGRWQIGTRLRIFAGAPPAAPVLAWSGTIDTLTLDGYAAGAPVCHVAAIDAVGRMNARNPVPLATPVGAGESAHARLTRILTRAGVPAASLDVEPAGPPMGATTHVDAPGVEAQQVAQAARWTLWVDAAGVVHVHPFLIDATPVPPPDVIFDCTTPGHARALDVAYASDPLQVRSSIDATGSSGNVIHVQDDGSLDRLSVGGVALGSHVDAASTARPARGRPGARPDRLDVGRRGRRRVAPSHRSHLGHPARADHVSGVGPWSRPPARRQRVAGLLCDVGVLPRRRRRAVVDVGRLRVRQARLLPVGATVTTLQAWFLVGEGAAGLVLGALFVYFRA
jgi:hypothetical protein